MDNQTMRGAVTPTESEELENAHLDQLTPQRKDRLLQCSTSRANYLQEFSEIKLSVDSLKNAIKNPLKLDSSRITGDSNLRGLFQEAVERGSSQDAVEIINRAIAYYELQMDFLQKTYITNISGRGATPGQTQRGIGAMFGRVFGRGAQTDLPEPTAALFISALKQGDMFRAKNEAGYTRSMVRSGPALPGDRVKLCRLEKGTTFVIGSVDYENGIISISYSYIYNEGRIINEQFPLKMDEFLRVVGATD